MDLEASTQNYLRGHHVNATLDWIRSQLADIGSVDPSMGRPEEQIYRRFLDRNWNDPLENFTNTTVPSMPADLDLNHLNPEKKTFTGKYLCQINQIINISKPLCYELEDEIPNLEDRADEDTDWEDFANLFTKKGTKNSKPKPKGKVKSEVREFGFGARMLQLSLSDGHCEAIAIEYVPIPALNTELLGAKMLLIGPFDVYVGTIFLRPQNVEIVSSVTFDLNGFSPMPPGSGDQPMPLPSCNQPIAERANLDGDNPSPQFDVNDLLGDCDDLFEDIIETEKEIPKLDPRDIVQTEKEIPDDDVKNIIETREELSELNLEDNVKTPPNNLSNEDLNNQKHEINIEELLQGDDADFDIDIDI